MWKRIKKFFKDSETIFWSRVQVLLGLLATAIVSVDPNLVAPFMKPEHVPLLFVVNGLVTEVLRRRRDAEM